MPHRPIAGQREGSPGPITARAGMLLPVALLLAAGAASSAPVGCATKPAERAAAAAGPSSQTAEGEPFAELIARQQRRPDGRAIAAPAPPGLPPALSERLDEAAAAKASRPLADVLAEFSGVPAPDASSNSTSPTAEDRSAAIKLYLSARAKRLAGDFRTAEADVRDALKLDDSAPEPWRELGEAQLRAGNAAGARQSFEETLNRAPNDIRALEQLSRFALERRETEPALRYLARLSRESIEAFDPALPLVASARLGRALIDLGYLSAGAESLRTAAELPQSFNETTAYQLELGSLYRQAGDLWRDAGDALLRTGDAAGARECYERAATLPSLNPGALSARLIYSSMRRGHSAEAARFLFEQIKRDRGRIDDRTEALIGFLASNSSVGPDLAAAIEGVSAALPPSERAVAAGALVRARAAALPAERGAALLRDRLAEAPADAPALRALLARLDPKKTDQLLGEWVRLIDRSPMHEALYAEALLQRDRSAAKLLEAWGTLDSAAAQSTAGRLLHARLLASTGEVALAESELAALLIDVPAESAAAVARASMLVRLGRLNDAQSLLAGIPDGPSLRERFAKASVLAEMGDSERAIEVLSPALNDPLPTEPGATDVALLAARVSAALGRAADAERYFAAVTRADPTREEAYAGLLALYGSGGPLQSDPRLVETIRALRDANPSSPTLRWLRAQESAARGQYDLAERDLLDLAEEYPGRRSVVDLLVRLWTETRSLQRAEEWLARQVERRPDDPAYTIRFAEVLAEGRGAERAVSLLSAWLDKYPGDVEASRALEKILREKTGDSRRANELAEQRLARGPRNADAIVELAELRARTEKLDEVASLIRELAARPGPLRNDLSAKLDAMALAIGEQAIQSQRGYAKANEIAAAVVERFTGSDRLALVSLRLMVLSGTPTDSIAAAALSASQRSERMRIPAVWFPAREFEARAQRAGERDREGARRAGSAIVRHVAENTRPLPSDLAALWIHAGLEMFEDDDAIADAYASAAAAGAIDAVFDELGKFYQRQGDAQGVRVSADLRSELAEFVAGALDAGVHDALTDELYRLAIKYNPKNSMAHNNLGYRLLERGGDIREAESHIAAAYQESSSEASITDSLGWVRYKLGQFTDTRNPETGDVIEGAVTLLARSLELTKRNERDHATAAIVSSHLGDARSAAGDREGAVTAWRDCVRYSEIAVLQLEEIRRNDQNISKRRLRAILRVMREIDAARQAAEANIAAVEAGQAPTLAPLAPAGGAPPPPPG